jgi:SAM-dependent methyltransferase
MNLKHSFLRPLAHAIYNRGPVSGLASYFQVVKEFLRYRKDAVAENVPFRNFSPWPIDRYGQAGDAGMYFYQDTWCANKIAVTKPSQHVDVGSSMMFVAMALQICDLLYVDVRPISINLPRFSFQQGDLVALPFDSGSVASISSLSVVEHIGLGRYGDRIDPQGTDKACKELARVVRPNGNLYVAVPTEVETSTHFNAHRIFAPDDFIAKFPGLRLVDEQYGLSDRIVCRCEYEGLGMPYAYGCFQFTKDGY